MECLVRFYCYHVLYARSVDPDQTPRLVASDIGLHCMPMSILWEVRYTWVKGSKKCIKVKNVCKVKYKYDICKLKNLYPNRFRLIMQLSICIIRTLCSCDLIIFQNTCCGNV